MSSRALTAGAGFLMALACPSCLHTQCGPECKCACRRTTYSACYTTCRALRLKAKELGRAGCPGDFDELAAIARLEKLEATRADVVRLRDLALLAKLPWDELFPADG